MRRERYLVVFLCDGQIDGVGAIWATGDWAIRNVYPLNYKDYPRVVTHSSRKVARHHARSVNRIARANNNAVGVAAKLGYKIIPVREYLDA